MIWRGQIKAIMAIVVVVGLGITFATRSPRVFLGLVILVPVAALVLGIVNTISTAFSGKPLIYDVKIMQTKSSSGGEVHSVSAPSSASSRFLHELRRGVDGWNILRQMRSPTQADV